MGYVIGLDDSIRVLEDYTRFSSNWYNNSNYSDYDLIDESISKLLDMLLYGLTNHASGEYLIKVIDKIKKYGIDSDRLNIAINTIEDYIKEY